MTRLILAVFFVIFVIHDAHSCCFPKQLEGFEGVSGGQMVNGTGVAFQALFNVSLDFSIKKVALSGTIFSHGVTTTEQILQDFSAGKQYIVINGKCTAYPLSGEAPSCVPASAQKVMSTYYGIGNHKINVDLYGYTIINQKYILTVAPDEGCIPMSQHVEFPQGITDGGFMGLTLGIRDMRVFNIPKACLRKMYGPVEQLKMDHALQKRHSYFVRF